MKLIHISDLHLGKSLHMVSMREAQQDILEKILQKINDIRPDAVLIAGDLYDRRIPPEWAVNMLDDFLYALSLCRTADGRRMKTLLISGNHDSAERVAYGGRLMEASGLYVSPAWQAGSVKPVVLEDAYGPVHIYLLPYVTRFEIKAAFPERGIDTCSEALKAAIDDMHVDPRARNVLVAHQFVTDAALSGSEDIVGGLDSVDAEVFDDFDYVALGHLHGAQWVHRETVRYSGSPLKYSAAEAEQEKSLTVVELAEKGTVHISTQPLHPLHDLARIRGTFAQLLRPDEDQAYGRHREDYLEITLTDEQPPAGAAAQLREIYPRLLHLCFDNTATRAAAHPDLGVIDRRRPVRELLEEFYSSRHDTGDGAPVKMTPAQLQYAEETLAAIAAERSEQS